MVRQERKGELGEVREKEGVGEYKRREGGCSVLDSSCLSDI